MRGRIIHYNAADGKGLVAAGQRQHPFEIVHWRSETAPAVNQAVDIGLDGEQLTSVTRVPDEILLKEKAEALAGRFGSAGAAALRGIGKAGGDAATGIGARAGGGAAAHMARLGKPALIAHALFVVSAMFLPYLKIEPMFGPSRGFSLLGLSKLSEQFGSSIGGSFLPWLAILSIAVPVFWHRRWAWLALLLPLIATVKPFLDMLLAIQNASKGLSEFDARMGSAIADQLLDMLDTGIGLWLCLAAALVLAAFALKRTLLPPNPGIVRRATE